VPLLRWKDRQTSDKFSAAVIKLLRALKPLEEPLPATISLPGEPDDGSGYCHQATATTVMKGELDEHVAVATKDHPYP